MIPLVSGPHAIQAEKGLLSPVGFATVQVNGEPLKAFVDSGAQSTITSLACAERLNLTHLLDKRFSGVAMYAETSWDINLCLSLRATVFPHSRQPPSCAMPSLRT